MGRDDSRGCVNGIPAAAICSRMQRHALCPRWRSRLRKTCRTSSEISGKAAVRAREGQSQYQGENRSEHGKDRKPSDHETKGDNLEACRLGVKSLKMISSSCL
jgi:hypothetical protein